MPLPIEWLRPGHQRPSLWIGALVTVVAITACTLVVALLDLFMPVDSLGTVYIAPVVLVAAEWGSALGVVCALLSAFVFDYFFIPPVMTLHVVGRQDWVPFI